MSAVRLRAKLLSIVCVICFCAADWPRFRGPDGTALSDEAGVPLKWSDTENIVWKAKLPGPGSSSPIVARDRVFVTCYSGYGTSRDEPPGEQKNLVRHLICVRADNGEILWKKDIPALLPEDPYQGMLRDHGYASSTPATDGERVFAFFGKSGVVAFDWDGAKIWETSVGTNLAMMGFGSGASLALHENLVIVNANAESGAIVALDKATGSEVWKAPAEGYNGSWSTPVVVQSGGKPELIVNMPGEMWGLDPKDGGLLWFSEALRSGAVTSVAVRGDTVFGVGGGPAGSSVVAVRTGGRDDVTNSHVLWKKSLGSYVPSPVAVGDHLYWVDDRGLAYCLRADTGEQVYRERLRDARGVYASLVLAGGKLYAVSRANGTYVLPASPKFELLAHNVIASDTSDFNATPAVHNSNLLIRSDRFLYCIGKQ